MLHPILVGIFIFRNHLVATFWMLPIFFVKRVANIMAQCTRCLWPCGNSHILKSFLTFYDSNLKTYSKVVRTVLWPSGVLTFEPVRLISPQYEVLLGMLLVVVLTMQRFLLSCSWISYFPFVPFGLCLILRKVFPVHDYSQNKNRFFYYF